MAVASFVVLLLALPPCDGQSTASTATYLAPLKRPGSEDKATIKIRTPDASGKFPVFMWLAGTFDHYNATVLETFTEYMASKGYIAAIPEYQVFDFCMSPCLDDRCPLSLGKLVGIDTGAVGKIGQPEKVRALKKALDVLCALPKADCSLGVAVAGHSQGAFSTVQFSTIDKRVTAISPWSYGYLDLASKELVSCVTAANVDKFIPKEKRRTVVGALDDLNSGEKELDMKGPQVFSGYTCNSSTAPINCIQSDGSGYYVIAKSEYTAEDKRVTDPENIAGHPFFDTKDPVADLTKLVPSFKTGNKLWHMKPMFDWLSMAARVVYV